MSPVDLLNPLSSQPIERGRGTGRSPDIPGCSRRTCTRRARSGRPAWHLRPAAAPVRCCRAGARVIGFQSACRSTYRPIFHHATTSDTKCSHRRFISCRSRKEILNRSSRTCSTGLRNRSRRCACRWERRPRWACSCSICTDLTSLTRHFQHNNWVSTPPKSKRILDLGANCL